MQGHEDGGIRANCPRFEGEGNRKSELKSSQQGVQAFLEQRPKSWTSTRL
jgi:hypothetical protein